MASGCVWPYGWLLFFNRHCPRSRGHCAAFVRMTGAVPPLATHVWLCAGSRMRIWSWVSDANMLSVILPPLCPRHRHCSGSRCLSPAQAPEGQGLSARCRSWPADGSSAVFAQCVLGGIWWQSGDKYFCYYPQPRSHSAFPAWDLPCHSELGILFMDDFP